VLKPFCKSKGAFFIACLAVFSSFEIMYSHTKTVLLAFVVFVTACTTKKKTPPVQSILYNATFYTLNDSIPTVEAVAISDGKIVGMGTKDNLLKQFAPDTLQNLQGAFVYPGFIDGHAHFYGLGMFTTRADLTGSKSFDEVLTRLQAFAKTNTHPWLQGRGWDQNLWEGKKFPTKTKLDELYPDIPVLLKRIDGHGALANQKALNLAGITQKSFIAGGMVEVVNGQLTGILLDNAVDSVEKSIPEATDEQIKNYLLKAQDICFANGLTTVVDAGLEKRYIDIIQQLQAEGKLKIRLNVMVSANDAGLDYYLKNGPIKTPLLNVSSFKLYADGALGSRGACLLQPYTDVPETNGFLLSSPEKLTEVINRVAKSNFQLCTHCIGDSANRFVLNAYGAALGENNHRRWRIEHAQVVSTQDVPKYKQLGVLPSMQPTHATSDHVWAIDRLGPERIKTAYCLKTLMQQNGMIVLGTDFPIEGVNPLETFYVAVKRATYDELMKKSELYPADSSVNEAQWGFQPEEALSRLEALKGVTLWAAYGSFEENEKGSMAIGKYADFTVLNNDILTTKNLHQTNVLSTWVNGICVFNK
jgi:predicted amidohydrolase YtcJ